MTKHAPFAPATLMSFRKYRKALWFTCCAVGATAGQAQTAERVDAPYSHVLVRASVLNPIHIGTLTSYYATAPGAAIDAEVPFEAGSLGITYGWTKLLRRPSDGVDAPSTQDFRVRLIGINWRLPAVESGRMHAQMGFRAATFRLLLGDTVATVDDLTEDELSLGVTGRVAVRLRPSMHVAIGGDVSRVFSNIPWTITTLSAGVEWVHPLPKRVRDWLR